MKHELWELQSMQAAPLSVKVSLTKDRIREWVKAYGEDGVCVSFSGGKDSTVLLHLVRELYPSVPAVFVDVPTQYPELREFAKTFDNVEIVRPRLNFMEVCEKYGFPLISKEVSECVQGARKYLTSVIKKMSIANERTNERHTHTDSTDCADSESLLSLIGGGTTGSGGNSGESGSLQIRVPEDVRHRQIWETIRKCKIGGVEKQGDLLSQQESSLLTALLNRDYGKTIDNMRVQRIMGILPLRGKATAETIPDEKDKSMFSCERYQFFLDAPFEISHMCCKVMKKEPLHNYQKKTNRKPMTAQMASESRLRTQVWLRQGCNAFDAKSPISNPMAFWTEQDVLLYIYQNHIPICSVYGEVVKDNEIDGQLDFEDLGLFDLGRPVLKTTGCERTGCMLCGFGCHLEKGESRFQRLQKTHPGMYKMLDVVSNNGVTFREAIEWTNEHGDLNIKL